MDSENRSVYGKATGKGIIVGMQSYLGLFIAQSRVCALDDAKCSFCRAGNAVSQG